MSSPSNTELEEIRFDSSIPTTDFLGWLRTEIRRNPDAFSSGDAAPKRRGRKPKNREDSQESALSGSESEEVATP